MIETNSLIKASAGTGKTFALATRFIRLMMFDRVDVRSIVALTFSRAAAHEIYTKILGRLGAAAKDDQGAAKEWQNLLADYREAVETGADNGIPLAAARYQEILQRDIPHAAVDFQRLLRQLVDSQHLGTIATIDSFILRIVQNFPLEMGFQNAVEVLDPADSEQAVEESVRRALASDGGSDNGVAECFRVVRDGKFSRTCLAKITGILNKDGWRRFVVDHPECVEWTLERMCAVLGIDGAAECPDLSGLPFNQIARKNAVSYEEQFVRHVRKYRPDKNPLDAGDGVVALMRHLWENPDATSYRYEYYRHWYDFNCGAEGAAKIRGAIKYMVDGFLRHQLTIVLAKIRLSLLIGEVYHQSTRRGGKLTFEDFTAYSAKAGGGEDGGDARIRDVEFRFDAKFAHWALDEFQDTSALQWKCLREFVENAANEGHNGESRSAMIVGDFKQSIYTWRGASAAPFTEVSDPVRWPSFNGCRRDFKLSHRYGPNITDLVNRVFGAKSITTAGLIPDFCGDAVTAWDRDWVEHVSEEPVDYLKVIGVESGDDMDEAVLSELWRQLAALWSAYCHSGRREEIGVLVRSNTDGNKVAQYLRERGLPVVWEGLNTVHDLPIVQAVLELLRLAEHPEDSAAWETVETLYGIRSILLPECTTAAAVSARVARLLARQGLARTLKDFCGVLCRDVRLDPTRLSFERLGQLVELGVAFESRPSGGGIDDFIRFLGHAHKRELAASSEVIRIMTIHRSKGLGFDHLFVPLFEDRARSVLFASNSSAPLFAEGQDWVLPHLKRDLEPFNAQVAAAAGTMRNHRLLESLRTYYVALTRAKKSMFVIFPDDRGDRKTGANSNLLMRDLITDAVGGQLPYEQGVYPVFVKQDKNKGGDVSRPDPFPPSGTRELVERVSPSGASHGTGEYLRGRSADLIFDRGYGSGAARGIEVHAQYQQIEWASGAELERLPSAFRVAFAKPSPEATVWRERSYERFDGEHWETGQFDRVVFAGAGESRSAVIYDFKTNAQRKGESDDEFAARMREYYSPQMARYREALASVTGLPPARIRSVLLLVSSEAAVACE